MDASQVYLSGTINKEEEKELAFVSFDQKLPKTKQIGNTLTDIQKYVVKGGFNIYPPQANRSSKKTRIRLHEVLQNLSHNGLAYVADNLSVSADLSKPKPEPQPNDVILDVCLLVQGLPPTVFTVVKDNPVSLNKAKSYNLTLVQGVIKAVRRLTTEQFSAVYGLIQESDLNTQGNFQNSLENLHKQSSRLYNPGSLQMHEDKCKNIICSFLCSVALSHSVVNDDKSDTLWFLSLEQFCILTENIDQKEMIVRTAPSSGGKVLMREVARRLERSGPTVLIMKSAEDIQTARVQKTCSKMLTLKQLRDDLGKGETFEGFRNQVTNCQDCPVLSDVAGRYWTFLQENASSEELPAVKITTKEGSQGQIDRSEDGKSQDVSISCEISSHAKILDKDTQVKSEIDNKDTRIHELMLENATLKQKSEDFTRWLDSMSLSVQSSDSGHYSDMSSRLSLQAPSGEHGESKGVMETIKKRFALWKSKSRAGKEIPIYMYVLYNDDKTTSITMQCRYQEMDRDRVNIEFFHVSADGLLVNCKPSSRSQQGSRRFKQYWGTCGTFTIRLSLSSSCTYMPHAPQYWETETTVWVKNISVWNVLEMGVVEEDNLDRGVWVYNRPRSWCVMVGHCTTHQQPYCLQVWNQEKYVRCEKEALKDTPDTPQTLRYGVVVDVVKGRVGFVDVDRGIVLEKMDVEFKETLCPVFGVWPDPTYGTVEMRLVSGTDIMMTEEKQKLLFTCLA